MTKFNVGDTVRLIRDCSGLKAGYVGPIVLVEGELFVGETPGQRCGCEYSNWEMVAEAPKQLVKFILQYELDEDPLETFATLTAAKNRVKELAARPDLKRDSIVLYEVAKIYNISLDTTVSMKAVDEVTEVKEESTVPKTKRKKRAHKKHLFQKECSTCLQKYKGAPGLAIHMAKAHKA